MEIIIALVAIAVLGAVFYFNRTTKNFDVNNDGKVDLNDAKAAVDNTVTGVTTAADVNKDGKIDAEDAKVVVEKTKQATKRVATKAANKTKAAAKQVVEKVKPGPKPKAKV